MEKQSIVSSYIREYSVTPLIRINWNDEPSEYVENPDNWTFFECRLHIKQVFFFFRILDKIIRKAIPNRIIGDPNNQRSDKRNSTVNRCVCVYVEVFSKHTFLSSSEAFFQISPARRHYLLCSRRLLCEVFINTSTGNVERLFQSLC